MIESLVPTTKEVVDSMGLMVGAEYRLPDRLMDHSSIGNTVENVLPGRRDTRRGRTTTSPFLYAFGFLQEKFYTLDKRPRLDRLAQQREGAVDSVFCGELGHGVGKACQ